MPDAKVRAHTACICTPSAVMKSVRRAGQATSWGLPTALLILLPKCPLCLAAYLAVLGGTGISVAALMHLRFSVVWICWTVLLLLTLRLAMRLYRQFLKQTHHVRGIRPGI